MKRGFLLPHDAGLDFTPSSSSSTRPSTVECYDRGASYRLQVTHAENPLHETMVNAAVSEQENGSDEADSPRSVMTREDSESSAEPDFVIEAPWTPTEQVVVPHAHRPIHLISFLEDFQVEWEHPLHNEFHPEFSIARTRSERFAQVQTGVIAFCMDAEISAEVPGEWEGYSLYDLIGDAFMQQFGGETSGWMWQYFGLHVWRTAGTTYFQFLRSERRITEVDDYWAPDVTPWNHGPAPSLLGTRKYDYEWDNFHLSQDYYTIYHNESPVTLLKSGEEFHALDESIPWEVVFDIVFTHMNTVNWP